MVKTLGRRAVGGWLVLWVALVGGCTAPGVLVQGHAHNDYQHARPLLDALDHGYGSVEADVFLMNGALLVGHTPLDLRSERTLEGLYLAPLRERVRRNGGAVYADGPTLYLLIDLKTEPEATYAALREALGRYEEMLTVTEAGQVRTGAVTVLLTGNRPTARVAAETRRLVALDGRVADLAADPPAALMPLISDNWRQHFNWRGQGAMPEAERLKLRTLVRQAHAQGRRVRFWGTPDEVEVWRELRAAGVDLMGTDDLGKLQRFLAER